MYIRIALRSLKVPYSDVGEEGVAVNYEKNTIFLNALYLGIEIVNPSVRISAEHTTVLRRFYRGYAPNKRQRASALPSSVGLFLLKLSNAFIASKNRSLLITKFFTFKLQKRVFHITYYILHSTCS